MQRGSSLKVCLAYLCTESRGKFTDDLLFFTLAADASLIVEEGNVLADLNGGTRILSVLVCYANY